MEPLLQLERRRQHQSQSAHTDDNGDQGVVHADLFADQLNELVDNIENYYANRMLTETTTSEIGDRVLAGLKELDLVAYVRFASVYKDFNDVDSFVQIITELSEK